MRVGILGLITRDVASWEPASHVEGLRFTDSVEEARRWVPVLRGRERCDLVIVLTHQGFERDPETGADRGSAQENQAYALATEVPGIDLLLTGHTHTLIEPRRLGSAWVSQPGRFGNALTRFDVRFERRDGRWAVGGIVGKNLSMKGVEADGEIRSVVEPEHRAAMEALARPLATLAVRLTAAGARTSDTALLDWLHSVQLREGKADLSFASLLPGGLPAWEPGPLTLRQVWSFYPYENTLVTVRATGRQIRRALETAARCVSGIGEQGGRPVWKRNPSVWGYNCDTLAGADYALDPTRAERERLLFLKRKGAVVADEESFSVAINSYRAAGGGGYGVWRDCPRLSESRRTLRELLVEDARARVTLRPAEDRNWLLAPSLPEGSLLLPLTGPAGRRLFRSLLSGGPDRDRSRIRERPDARLGVAARGLDGLRQDGEQAVELGRERDRAADLGLSPAPEEALAEEPHVVPAPEDLLDRSLAGGRLFPAGLPGEGQVFGEVSRALDREPVPVKSAVGRIGRGAQDLFAPPPCREEPRQQVGRSVAERRELPAQASHPFAADAPQDLALSLPRPLPPSCVEAGGELRGEQSQLRDPGEQRPVHLELAKGGKGADDPPRVSGHVIPPERPCRRSKPPERDPEIVEGLRLPGAQSPPGPVERADPRLPERGGMVHGALL